MNILTELRAAAASVEVGGLSMDSAADVMRRAAEALEALEKRAGLQEGAAVGPETEFAVLGFYSESGQIFCHHVEAQDGLGAFAKVAAGHEQLMEFVAALPVADSKRMEYPGDGLVDAITVREQPDVFPLDEESQGPRP